MMSGKYFKWRRRGVIGLTLIAAICFLLIGCKTSILPPQSPAQPTTVCIVDYGRHASLVLPDRTGSVEYEYGEWKWFALGHDQSSRILPTLFRPTQGTLGRRQHPFPPDSHLLKSQSFQVIQSIYSFEVSDKNAEAVREKLGARYNAGLQTEIFNREYDMNFVKDPADYSAFHNCNHELAKWLMELGCNVQGSTMFARFKVRN